MSFWIDDLPAMMADFGVDVRLSNRGTFTAIFERQYAGIGDVAVESTSPALTCRTSDVESLSRGDTVTVEGSEFTIRSIQPDGMGVTILILEAA